VTSSATLVCFLLFVFAFFVVVVATLPKNDVMPPSREVLVGSSLSTPSFIVDFLLPFFFVELEVIIFLRSGGCLGVSQILQRDNKPSFRSVHALQDHSM